MFTAILLCSLACVALDLDEAPGPEKTDLEGYSAAAAKVERTPEAQVKLALWCEAHGLKAERLKHLALAVLLDPKDAAARGLMGLVAYRGRWLRPEAVGARVQSDEELAARLAEYNARRAALPANAGADAHWKLGRWCEQNGLEAEAFAHFTTVTRLDPGREAAWKRLGCRKVGGRWLTEAQIAAEKDEAEAQKRADKHWKPLLTRWRGWLADKDRRAEAEAALAQVRDPHAVPPVWSVFAEAGAKDELTAVQLLGQIDSPRAARGLALLAVFSDSASVRRAASQTLRRRDSRDYFGTLIALLRKRIKYEVRPVGGPGSPGVLFVEGKPFNVQRLYAPPAMPVIPILPTDFVYIDAYGLPEISRYLGTSIQTQTVSNVHTTDLGPRYPAATREHYGINTRNKFVEADRNSLTTGTTVTTQTPFIHSMQIPIGELMLEYQTAAIAAQQQLSNDVAVVEGYNKVMGKLNDGVTQVLKDLSGEDYGEDPQAWTAWWADQLGYTYRPNPVVPVPTVYQNVPLAYVPPGVPMPVSTRSGTPTSTTSYTDEYHAGELNHSCFKAGTPVQTLGGHRAIETIQVGDQVLAQDARTGALSYQPVVAVFHNRPSTTLRIDLDGETIVATPIHRFWKAGEGWVMARDLKPGDRVRTLDGLARVASVGSDQVQPVFNLQAGPNQSFFVGKAGILVHDNSVIEPVTAPFDAPPSLASVIGGAPSNAK